MHPLLAVDAVLIFALSVPVVMGYRILPVVGTPYWLFGILFLILVTHVLISVYPQSVKRWVRDVMTVKRILLYVTLGIVAFGVTWTAIADRARIAPEYEVHDIILQQESAMRYLVVGKNPYKETYHGTFLEKFRFTDLTGDAENPALYHFVMPPWYLVFPFAFYYTTPRIFGFFDGRMASMFALAGLIVVFAYWYKDKLIGNLAMVLTALSPAVFDYFLEGRSDTFALFWFIAALFLLERKKHLISAVMFGFALVSKQTIWFAAPFYYVYLWKSVGNDRGMFVRHTLISIAMAGLVVAPFLLWDAQAYMDSTVKFLMGTTEHAYPVSGYGLGAMLHSMGVIKDIYGYYPFIVWQTVFALPVLGFSLWLLYKKPTMSRLLLGYTVSLMAIWYFSRYFNNSHVSYLSSVFILGVLKDMDEKGIVASSK